VVAGVTTESTLVDFSVWSPVERETHVFQVDDGVDCFFGENFCRVLVDEVVAAFHGVEGVPLPGVVFDVRKSRCHPTLRCTGVRPGGVKL